MSACGSRSVRISGQIAQPGVRTIYLEQVMPSGSKVIDSTTSGKRGVFALTVDRSEAYPGFYNIIVKGGGKVSLLASAGEKINISMSDTTANDYIITGSHDSEMLHVINKIMQSADLRLDSLQQAFATLGDNVEVDTTAPGRLAQEYVGTQIALKRSAIDFIVNNSKSLVAIVPLYQATAGGDFIFSEPYDVIYYQMISDSLTRHFPDSPYTRSLALDVESLESSLSGSHMMEANSENFVDFPDIAMNDPLGKVRRLSELRGKLILLSFTTSTYPQFKILNRELVEIYNKYHDRGFEVYQVSLEDNKATWIGAVAEQRLPWISVSDLKGPESPAVGLYNVKKVPTNILIDRQGHILDMNLAPGNIDKAVAGAI